MKQHKLLFNKYKTHCQDLINQCVTSEQILRELTYLIETESNASAENASIHAKYILEQTNVYMWLNSDVYYTNNETKVA